jgi:sphingolipid C9-methyltransferase
MAEHVGLRRYQEFLRQVYTLLDDDGVFVLQVAGIRCNWQFEDLVWGLFMNKYIFPGADASASLGEFSPFLLFFFLTALYRLGNQPAPIRQL